MTDMVEREVLELDFRSCIFGVTFSYYFGQIASIAWRSEYWYHDALGLRRGIKARQVLDWNHDI